MKFPIRHFHLASHTLASALMKQKPYELHFLRFSKRVAIVWSKP